MAPGRHAKKRPLLPDLLSSERPAHDGSQFVVAEDRRSEQALAHLVDVGLGVVMHPVGEHAARHPRLLPVTPARLRQSRSLRASEFTGALARHPRRSASRRCLATEFPNRPRSRRSRHFAVRQVSRPDLEQCLLRADADVDRIGELGRSRCPRRARGPWSPAPAELRLARRSSRSRSASTASTIGLLHTSQSQSAAAGLELAWSR